MELICPVGKDDPQELLRRTTALPGLIFRQVTPAAARSGGWRLEARGQTLVRGSRGSARGREVRGWEPAAQVRTGRGGGPRGVHWAGRGRERAQELGRGASKLGGGVGAGARDQEQKERESAIQAGGARLRSCERARLSVQGVHSPHRSGDNILPSASRVCIP